MQKSISTIWSQLKLITLLTLRGGERAESKKPHRGARRSPYQLITASSHQCHRFARQFVNWSGSDKEIASTSGPMLRPTDRYDRGGFEKCVAQQQRGELRASKSPRAHIGGWMDGDHQKQSLSLCRVVQPRAPAARPPARRHRRRLPFSPRREKAAGPAE